jgi:hypothetical protein
MNLAYRYNGPSTVVNGIDRAKLAFSANTLREHVAFDAQVKQPVLFREALAALYAVVVSDFKFRPRDRFAFQLWLEEQDRQFLAKIGLRTAKARQRSEEIQTRLDTLQKQRHDRLRPFFKAREEFFEFVYENEYEMEFLLDPIITVHPDEVSFEAFSRDESTYARLAVKHDAFTNAQPSQLGTTNIDFSAKLHSELERMRSYRQTRFQIDPGGLTTQVGSSSHKEKKIAIPDSWIKGLLQVHSTMTLGLTRVSLAPADLFNICRYLRRRKPRTSPRALRYELTPGEPGRVVLEPWEHVIPLTGADHGGFLGAKPVTFRTWGRQRLVTIARLLPVCQRIDVFLAGYGLPSVYVLDLGPMTFTLALSGWTDNDWTGETKHDVFALQTPVLPAEVLTVHDALKQLRVTSDAALATNTKLPLEKTRAAMAQLCGAGRAMHDLAENMYRFRDLFGTPFTLQTAAQALAKPPAPPPPVAKGQPAPATTTPTQTLDVRITARRPVPNGFKLTGSAKNAGDAAPLRPLLHVDSEGKIVDASCTCADYQKHKLTKGPCVHVLALRQLHLNLG